MKRMPLSRLFALPLALTLLLSPAAQALTPDQARELLQDYYIDEVPEDVLDQNTIQAMLEALGDPYTTYFSRGVRGLYRLHVRYGYRGRRHLLAGHGGRAADPAGL